LRDFQINEVPKIRFSLNPACEAGRLNSMARPIVHVIADPNGAGKTTFARVFLADAAGGENFLNADLLAAGLSPLAPRTMELRAGRLLCPRALFDEGVCPEFGISSIATCCSLMKRCCLTLLEKHQS
jgi:hypothetical protein